MLKAIHRHFTRHPALSPRWAIAIIIIAVMGFIDSGYLTYKHYANQVIPCPTVELVNTCQVVATSIYASMLGVPIALLGLLYYIAILLIGIIGLKEKYQFVLNFIPPLAAMAWLFSVRLVYLQFFVLYSICYYCLWSAILSTALLYIGVRIVQKQIEA